MTPIMTCCSTSTIFTHTGLLMTNVHENKSPLSLSSFLCLTITHLSEYLTFKSFIPPKKTTYSYFTIWTAHVQWLNEFHPVHRLNLSTLHSFQSHHQACRLTYTKTLCLTIVKKKCPTITKYLTLKSFKPPKNKTYSYFTIWTVQNPKGISNFKFSCNRTIK